MKRFIQFLFLFLLSTSANAQSKTVASTNSIQGKVVDSETNEVLPFALVYLKENKQRTATLADIDGNFVINIHQNDIKNQMLFEISLVGYDTFQFIIKKKKLPVKNLKLKLHESKNLLQEIY